MRKLLLLLLLPIYCFGQAPTSDSTKLSPNVSTSFNSFYVKGSNASNAQFGWLWGTKWMQLVTGYQFNNYTGTSTQAQITGLGSIYKLKNDSTASTGYQTVGNFFPKGDTRYTTIGSGIIHVATIADMQAISSSITTVIVTDTTRGKGINAFNYYPSSTAAIDNGVVFDAPGKGIGRWIRQYYGGGPVYPEWWFTTAFTPYNFTTKTGTDVKVAIQSAVNYTKYSGYVLITQNMSVSDSIRLYQSSSLVGINPLFPKQYSGADSIIYFIKSGIFGLNATKVLATNGQVDGFRNQGISIKNLAIGGSGKNNGATLIGVGINANATTIFKNSGLGKLEDCYIFNSTTLYDARLSGDSWNFIGNHFSDSQRGVRTGVGESFGYANDLYAIDSVAVELNGHNEVWTGTEVEPGATAIGFLVTGRDEIIHDNQFTNVKTAIKSLSGVRNNYHDNQITVAADTAFILKSQTGLTVHHNTFTNFSYVQPTIPYVYIKGSTLTKATDNIFTNTSNLNQYGILLDGGTVQVGSGNIGDVTKFSGGSIIGTVNSPTFTTELFRGAVQTSPSGTNGGIIMGADAANTANSGREFYLTATQANNWSIYNSGGSLMLSSNALPGVTSGTARHTFTTTALTSPSFVKSGAVATDVLNGDGSTITRTAANTASTIVQRGTSNEISVGPTSINGTGASGINLTPDAGNTANSERIFLSTSGTNWSMYNTNGVFSINSGGTFNSTTGTQRFFGDASGNWSATGAVNSGVAGSTIGSFKLSGNTSGTISINPQAAAGTYNFNLPITAGTAGQVLTSQAGGSTAMTWTTPITNPLTTNGDIIYGVGSTPTRLPIGTNGYFLQVQSGLPAYFNLLGGASTWTGNPTFNSDVFIGVSGGIAFKDASANTTYIQGPVTGTNTIARLQSGNGTLAFTGEIDNILSKTANYTIVGGDFVIGKKTTLDLYVDATAGAVAITLPSASTFAGYTIYITKTDASVNIVTVNTVTGANTILAQDNVRQFNSNGTAWRNH